MLGILLLIVVLVNVSVAILWMLFWPGQITAKALVVFDMMILTFLTVTALVHNPVLLVNRIQLVEIEPSNELKPSILLT